MRSKLSTIIEEKISSSGSSSSSHERDADDDDNAHNEVSKEKRCNGDSDKNIDTIKTSSNSSNHELKVSRTKKVVRGVQLQKLIMELVPVKIEWSDVLGRYLVATRDIKQSELIFQVEPIVAGPTPSYTENEWICMSCFRATKKKTMVRCSDCQWPFCSKECEEVMRNLTKPHILKSIPIQCECISYYQECN